MSRRHFSILAFAALAVGIIVLLLPSRTAREDLPGSQAVGRAVLPGLAAQINEAEGLEVTGAGGRTLARLERQGDRWSIVELAGYPADFATVRSVLAGLAQAEIIEPKTANPEFYPRLGVEEVDSPEAGGVLLTVTVAGQPHAVILGNTAPSRRGRYLRLAGEARSLLADFEAEVPENATGWADPEIVDLPPATVAEVVIEHPDGERLRVSKQSADDTDYALEGGIPEGRELVSSWSVNSLGAAFSGLNLEGVRRAQTLDWTEATRIRALDFAGLRVEAELVERDGQHWLRLSAEAPDAPPSPGEAKDAEATGSTDDGLEPAARAQEIDSRVRGWAFAIPAYKAETLDKRLEDLLQAPEEEAES